MFDYSTILLEIEQAVKRLDDACLHKKYTEYLADISKIHSNLTLLAAWMSEQKIKDRNGSPTV